MSCQEARNSCLDHSDELLKSTSQLSMFGSLWSDGQKILSISLIALGIAHIGELKWPRRYTGLNFIELPTFVIILGVMSFILAVGGCICSKSYSRIFYRWFLVTLILVLVLHVSISVMAFKTRSPELNQKVENALVTNEVIFTENHYKCCGLRGDEIECIEKKIKLGCAQEIIAALDQVFSQIGHATAYIASFQGIITACVSAIFYIILFNTRCV
ncbi:unnamed protein product [Acanthoscelides obtectus]|uniref:Tetraspanin n=1 Tax=Acanthoscelides obtectus TaxID=200917 RepID=A0A9P0L891_ACAOB|nr:unnamed protein product [Acanthoscelides obtectus]CAK1675193.1 hypothetical protein AOBTE_LOCUS30050 [Acanthoscelides obtectus]